MGISRHVLPARQPIRALLEANGKGAILDLGYPYDLVITEFDCLNIGINSTNQQYLTVIGYAFATSRA